MRRRLASTLTTIAVIVAFGGSAQAGTRSTVDRWVPAGPLANTVSTLASASPDLRVVFAVHGGILDRSGDHGRSWRLASSGLPLPDVRTVAVDLLRPRHVLAATSRGIYRSSDTGGSWDLATGRFLQSNSIVFLPGRPGVAIATKSGGGVVRTVDDGLHWTGLRGPEMFGLAAAPQSSGAIYSIDTLGERVHRSSDEGRTWKSLPKLPDGLRPREVTIGGDSTLYVGTSGNDGLLFRSTDEGRHWQRSDAGLDGYYLTALAVGPGHPKVVLAATDAITLADARVSVSLDSGRHWKEIDEGNGTVDSLLAGRTGAALAGGRTLRRGSFSPGAVWHRATAGLADGQVRQLTADPVHADTLWGVVAGLDREFEAADMSAVRIGPNWTLMGTAEETAKVVAPIADDLRSAFALSFSTCNNDFGECDHLSRWQPGSSAAIPSSNPREADSVVWTIATAPQDPLLIYEGRSSGLFRSEDGGQTWIPLAGAPGSTRAR
ncbi:MAG TPA: hypothetical protein VNN79_16645, partial [Actinomycetota bacterium]|nr:hypothetical protein [Actinomycetota bacterium]